MDTTIEYFNQKHPVSNLLKGKVVEGLPTKMEEIDLRFLRMIRLSDTWEGDGGPMDGTVYIAVFYGNQIAWETDKWYLGGSREMRREAGDYLYFNLYHASQLYLKILSVAVALYHGGKLKKDADTFYVNESDLARIKGHPQYLEMVRDFGLELIPTDKQGYLKVTISKFYEKE